jgi:NADH-quinone oxidoreductase subunit A
MNHGPSSFIPIVFQLMLALGFVTITMIVSHWLGPKLRTTKKLVSFESGIKAEGNARQAFAIKYFLTAILFVLFDVEVIFMYPWALNFKALGMQGIVAMLTFMAFLLSGFFYIVKKRALEWDD